MSVLVSSRVAGFRGSVTVPGDKSISHRALMFGGLALGTTTITGLLEGEDVLATAAAMRAMGATITKQAEGTWHVQGVGVSGLAEPEHVLDLGNSGTSTRLLMGMVASYPFTTFFTGDASLRRRPMARVITPLQKMGATFVSRSNGRLPLAITGATIPQPISYTLPVASAQVKSAILLAGLNTDGITTVIEPIPTRDHTERMLRAFGATVDVDIVDEGTRCRVHGYPTLTATAIHVPSDPSSAAFPAAAALISGGEVTLLNVCLNPHRIGFYKTIKEMGASLTYTNQRQLAGEDVADIIIKPSHLKGITVPANRAASMIDEYPILAVLASVAKGTTRMEGVGELRVKESDRLQAMVDGLTACGVHVESDEETLIVHGTGKPPRGGATIAANHDHRIAMSFAVLGMASDTPITIIDADTIATSFPTFVTLMNDCGARLDIQ